MNEVIPSLYLHDSSGIDYSIHQDFITSHFPITSGLFFGSKANKSWYGLYRLISKLFGRSNYLKCRALIQELIKFTPSYNAYQLYNSDTPMYNQDDLGYISSHFHQQCLKLFTLNAETLLEFILTLLSNPCSVFHSKSGYTLATEFKTQIIDFSDLFLPHKQSLYNIPLIFSILDDLSPPPLLSAVLNGQVENLLTILSIPTIDMNAKCWHLPSTILKMVNERCENATTLGEIAKPVIPGLNPKLVPLVPNKLLVCAPFPRDSLPEYPLSRIDGLFVYHNYDQLVEIPSKHTTFSQISQYKQILTESYDLMAVYYFITNQYASVLYAASSLITGSSNRKVTQRQLLIDQNPILYADEDVDSYPEAPSADIHPWFYPPSSPTPPESRAQQRSVQSSSRVPQIKYVYVSHDGSWKRVEDEFVMDHLNNPETSKRTYLLASSRQPRTLLTDGFDLVTILLKYGCEMLHMLMVIHKNYSDDTSDGGDVKKRDYLVTVPIPIALSDTLPTNALTHVARLSLRLGLVRYQRWCNHASNFLLDTFMHNLEYDRIKNAKYNRYNGHHWPYAYIKQRKTGTVFNTDKLIPNDVNMNTTPHILRDIKKDNIYLQLFGFIMTTRTTQIKLGIQEVPTPVSFNPFIPLNIEHLLSSYKKSLKKDYGENLDQFMDPSTKKLHLPSANNLPLFFSTLAFFYSYYFTIKHFNDLVNEQKRSNQKKKELGSSANKKPTDVPSFGKNTCYVRQETDRRLKAIAIKDAESLLEKATVKYVVPVEEKKEEVVVEKKPFINKKLQQANAKNELDFIMGSASKKKKDKVKLVKNAPKSEIPQSIPDNCSNIEKPTIVAPQEQSTTQVSPETVSLREHCDQLSQQIIEDNLFNNIPSGYTQHDIITTLDDFPRPLLFNNFYDSDDDMPLLVSLSRYYDTSITQCEAVLEKINMNSCIKEDDEGKKKIEGELKELKKKKSQIDERVLSPHFKNAPHVGKLMKQAYNEAKSAQITDFNNSIKKNNGSKTETIIMNCNLAPIESFSIDEYTQLYCNQLVLGSDGHCTTTTANSQNKTSTTYIAETTDNTLLNPLFVKSIADHRNMATIDMISNDHFITKDMANALEMSSTLASLVMMYCGQNTHRGYTDLQYTVKIGQPLAGFVGGK